VSEEAKRKGAPNGTATILWSIEDYPHFPSPIAYRLSPIVVGVNDTAGNVTIDDTIVDTIDDNILSIEGEQSEVIATTEDELKTLYKVGFIRTPKNEKLIIQNAQYRGWVLIKN